MTAAGSRPGPASLCGRFPGSTAPRSADDHAKAPKRRAMTRQDAAIRSDALSSIALSARADFAAWRQVRMKVLPGERAPPIGELTPRARSVLVEWVDRRRKRAPKVV